MEPQAPGLCVAPMIVTLSGLMKASIWFPEDIVSPPNGRHVGILKGMLM
jgi:hypothetical protein